MSGGFPVDLILFAMVAAFLVLRLRSVLGRRQGYERPPQERQAAAPPSHGPVEAEPQPGPAPEHARPVVPDSRTPTGQVLERMRQADPAFDPRGFLAGAEGAFRMIVEAFARGDRQTLRDLLAEETYAGFEQAITAREAAGERQRTEIRAIHEMRIESADLRGTVADITVRIVSDQVNVTSGAGGEIVAGAEAVTELNDIWTFQRDLSSGDPAWKLVGTRSA